MNETNLAEIYRDIANASGGDGRFEKTLKQIEKAAKKGRAYVEIECSEGEHNSIAYPYTYGSFKSEFIMKLEGHGFKINEAKWKAGLFSGTKHYMVVAW